MKHMGNSSNKSKKGNITNIPIIKLKVDKKEPKFNATETVKIRVTAECYNVTIPKNGLEYEWVYVDSTGFMKFFKTKKGVVMLHCPNFFCGRVMTVKVKVYLKYEESDEKIKFSSFDSGKFDILQDTIEVKPYCDKKFSDNAEWLPDVAEMPNCVQNSVIVYGYNGSELGLVRMIKEKGKIIWKREDKVVVQDNVVSALFNRSHCTSPTVNDNTYTLQLQLTNARNGKLLKSYSRDYTVKGRDVIKPITGFPIQPVMVGDVTITENNFKPCKYTRIDVEYISKNEPQQKMFFDEGVIFKAIPVYIIGGKSKTTVTLKDYNTQKCRLSSQEHTKAVFDSSSPPLDVKDGKIELNLKYDYGKDLDDSNLIEAWENGDYQKVTGGAVKFNRILKLLDYFLLPLDVVQRHTLQVATCRHSHTLELNMIPDIVWAFHVGFGRAYPDYSKLKTPKYNPKKSIRDQQKAAADARDSLLQGLEFEVGLSAEYNNGQVIDMKNSFIKQVEDASQKVETVMGWFQLDKFFKFKDKDAQKEFNERVVSDKEAIEHIGRKKTSSKHRPPQLPIPVFMSVDTPMLFVGGTWQYDVNSRNELSRKGTIYLEADPLIKVKGGIDLIACSQYIPVVGQIITAIIKGKDVLERGVNIVSNGKVDVNSDIWFDIFVEGTVNFKGELAISDDDTTIALEVKGTLMLGVELGIKCAVEVKTVTVKSNSKSTTTISGEVGIEGKVETGFSITPSLGYSSSKGVLVEVGAKFEGVIMDVSGTAKIEETKKIKKQVKRKKGKNQVEKEQDGFSYETKFGDSFQIVKENNLGKLEFNFQIKK